MLRAPERAAGRMRFTCVHQSISTLITHSVVIECSFSMHVGFVQHLASQRWESLVCLLHAPERAAARVRFRHMAQKSRCFFRTRVGLCPAPVSMLRAPERAATRMFYLHAATRLHFCSARISFVQRLASQRWYPCWALRSALMRVRFLRAPHRLQ